MAKRAKKKPPEATVVGVTLILDVVHHDLDVAEEIVMYRSKLIDLIPKEPRKGQRRQ